MAALRVREGAIMHYYNDIANNCTYGIGTLAHAGPCTPREMATPVTVAAVNMQLAAKIGVAESAVRRAVTRSNLTQAQFDALVSYTYNVGAHGALPVLQAANDGDDAQVVRRMEQAVYVHPRDAQGRRLPAHLVPGLVNRRRDEAAPFRLRSQGRQP
jgi:GH24 family phage-related lysozyme (muramidase)